MNLEQLNARISQLAEGESLKLEGIDASDYHASQGLGSTAIKSMANGCPATFKAQQETPITPSTAMEIGSAIHTGILEPFAFEDEFIRMPDSIKAKRGKDWEEWKADNEGKTVISAKDWETVEGCIDSVLESFAPLFSGGRSEVSYWHKDSETGLILKGRMDYMIDNHAIDLKTCADSKPEIFAKSALAFGYHIQEGLYADIAKADQFTFLAVGKKAPYICERFEFESDAKRLGYLLYRDAVKQIAVCINSDVWPGYTGGMINTIELPIWELKKLEQLEN